MKTIIFSLLFCLQALATTESVMGNGYSTGFCQGGGSSYFCLSQLEDRAKQDATRDADLQCRIRQGNLLYYTASCFTNCNPPFIPNDQNTYVSCNSRCRYDCDIRKP